MKHTNFTLLLICSLFFIAPVRAQRLDSLFKNPSMQVKPYVWWHWMGPNFSKTGITKDLEAMKAQGIGGATIFNVTSAVQESHAPTLGNPWPEQTYRSEAYWDALKFAALEAKRLGLEIGLHNTAGYSTTGGPWIDQERGMKKLVWRKQIVKQGAGREVVISKPSPVLSSGWGSITLPPDPSSWYKDIAYLAVPLKDSLSYTNERDFTAYFDADGKQVKRLPEGDWIIYRIGYAPTMAIPHPLPDDIIGRTYEADKMSRDQSVYHWNQVLAPLKAHLGPLLGNSFKHMLIDSYEAGYQNWTPDFRKEFIRLKGYDPLPWLLTFSDAITTEYKSDDHTPDRRIRFDAGQTSRFDWDYKDVISQLYSDHGWETGKKALHDAGLSLQWEPYGGPFDTIEGAASADLPMGEFWSGSDGAIDAVIPASARAAGKVIVGAEAFTGSPGASKYTEDPASLKPSAIGAFASGVNRLILHHWVHQPFDDQYQPGMGMGWWGTHFGRYQTWAEPGKAFFKFIGRSQALLQYGQSVSDYLCVDQLQGDADLISRRDFVKMDIQVKDGRIVLPSGRSYAFICFPVSKMMLPETAEKIKLLLGKGATVVANRPDRSPSLKDYPACDQALQKIASELWGNPDKREAMSGLLLSEIADALKAAGIQPDVRVESADVPKAIKNVHRTGPEGELYFVANLQQTAQNVTVSFRQKDLQPEIWKAEDGTIVNAQIWKQENGRTYVQLSLRDFQSVFIVFRKPAVQENHAVSVKILEHEGFAEFRSDGKSKPFITSSGVMKASVLYSSGKTQILNIKTPVSEQVKGPWRVQMLPKLGEAFSISMPVLKDLSLHSSDPRIAYFSGTAIYKKEVLIKQAVLQHNSIVMLDLGTLNDIVSVKVNGRDLGVLWYPPYIADVTDAVKTGINELEISVTNNWANRLIGDEQEAADFDWGTDRGDQGRAMKGYPDWFLKHQPRPSKGRRAFSVWYYYRKDSKLVPSGLAGPVRLIYQERSDL